MHFRQNAINCTKFGIQPIISQFKIVQNFFERCHSKAHFPVSVCCICFIMENIPAHRNLFQFIEILRRYSNFLIGYILAHVVMI